MSVIKVKIIATSAEQFEVVDHYIQQLPAETREDIETAESDPHFGIVCIMKEKTNNKYTFPSPKSIGTYGEEYATVHTVSDKFLFKVPVPKKPTIPDWRFVILDFVKYEKKN